MARRVLHVNLTRKNESTEAGVACSLKRNDVICYSNIIQHFAKSQLSGRFNAVKVRDGLHFYGASCGHIIVPQIMNSRHAINFNKVEVINSLEWRTQRDRQIDGSTKKNKNQFSRYVRGIKGSAPNEIIAYRLTDNRSSSSVWFMDGHTFWE